MDKNIEILKNGGIGVIATDTIYGIVGQALNRNTVARIYKVKKRSPSKPFIILINTLSDLNSFNVEISEQTKAILNSYWPGPVSIILDCHATDFEYLHRGTNTLAFRMPAKAELIEIIEQTGPLVAPSANPEGLDPAVDITAAKAYFTTTVDFYQEGTVNTKPSRIVKITDKGEEIIRP
ncbi:MAG: Sua5/YciO/YrdC/YwlC family protein [Candidatus Saccharibacteria bacterium]|nr:Sua5/YciO/YrdC/YwlC family protein [Candidatus Saccharibacteria bacterium]